MTTLTVTISRNDADTTTQFAYATSPLKGKVSVLPNMAVMNLCWRKSKRTGSVELVVAHDDAMGLFTVYNVAGDHLLVDATDNDTVELDPRDDDDADSLIEQFPQLESLVRQLLSDYNAS